MLQKVSIFLIRFYQTCFAWLPPVCRFTPSCSNYGLQAVKKYGFWKGWRLTIKRLLSCHPFCKGGHDPLI
ncbi:MAG TPA: membrane protein insertion efficiency factor YidD [Vampirovibrionales bacterium]